jgi:hypothetical protein
MSGVSSHRVFYCLTCGILCRICGPCDRGNRFCSEACAQSARKTQMRAACKRYQASPHGALLNAVRQKKWRTRQALEASCVTHQSSPELEICAKPDHEVANAVPARRVKAPTRRFASAPVSVCTFCGCPCGDLSRFDFHRGRKL